MIKNLLLLSTIILFLASCKDEPCDFDISGTYTFQSVNCSFLESEVPATITIANSATEFTFEGSRYEISDCEIRNIAVEENRMVTFDEGGFDFEGDFEAGGFSGSCEGRYTKN